MENTLNDIKNIIHEISSVNNNIKITESTKLFEELGISSINFVLLISTIEERFNITINFEEVDVLKINDVGSLIDLASNSMNINK
jgi:acyl carrier protein